MPMAGEAQEQATVVMELGETAASLSVPGENTFVSSQAVEKLLDFQRNWFAVWTGRFLIFWWGYFLERGSGTRK